MAGIGTLLATVADGLGINLKTIIAGIDDATLSAEERRGFEERAAQRILEGVKVKEETVRVETNAKRDVMIAELTQGDNFTKRARPSLIYAGLVLVFLVVGGQYAGYPPPEVPDQFWLAWGGACMMYVYKRSQDKEMGVESLLLKP